MKYQKKIESFRGKSSQCYKCEIGKHSQHSDWIGKGKARGLWKEAIIPQLESGEICTCPQCFDADYWVRLANGN